MAGDFGLVKEKKKLTASFFLSQMSFDGSVELKAGIEMKAKRARLEKKSLWRAKIAGGQSIPKNMTVFIGNWP